MKATLNIDDAIMAELKCEAARQGRTMSELVETALHVCSPLNESGGESPPYQSSAAAEHSSMLPIAMPCTTPWKVASARRRHECALRRRCGLAISYRLPRLARAPTGATGCLVPVGRSSLRMTSHAQPYDVPHVGRRGISLQRFSPRRAPQFLSRPNGSPTSPKRSLEPQARGTVSAVSTVLPRHLGMVVGATRDSGIASRAGFE
jgi:hypothetical protein